MRINLKHGLAMIAALSVFSSSAFGLRPCPPDVDCSGGVNIDDLLAVVNNWGQSGPNPADLDESGIVDIDDLLGVVNSWGPCLFDYGPIQPNTEAVQIGLEMLGSNGSLTLPRSTYQRVVRDLGLIRNSVPGLANQIHSAAWAPNQLIVGVQQGQAQTEYECLNTFYQVTDRQFLFASGGIEYWVITFAGKMNVAALANVYTLAAGVTSADPNGLIGGQNFYRPSDLGNGTWLWDIDDGFHDCFDGCDCHRLYLIESNAEGDVTLLSYSEQGQPWCEFETATELAAAGGGSASTAVRSSAR